jgi:ribosomal-protein-alanine N-acetyltransferase
MQSILTERLLLRPLHLADAPGMFELDTDPAVHRYLGGIGGPRLAIPTDSEATIRFIQAQYAAHGIGRWAVALRATGEFMGWAGLKLVTEPVNGQRDFYDLGYRFIPRYWSQGYGYEAARAWLRAGFDTLKVPRICAYADENNTSSRRILVKIGLQEGNAFVENGTACVWYEAVHHTPHPAENSAAARSQP